MNIDKPTEWAIGAITGQQECSPERQWLARAVIIDALVQDAGGARPIELAERAMDIDDQRARAEILGKVATNGSGVNGRTDI